MTKQAEAREKSGQNRPKISLSINLLLNSLLKFLRSHLDFPRSPGGIQVFSDYEE
jgi:hypothetical protein